MVATGSEAGAEGAEREGVARGEGTRVAGGALVAHRKVFLGGALAMEVAERETGVAGSDMAGMG